VTSSPENHAQASGSEIWTVKRILQSSADWLKSKNADPYVNHRLDAEVILAKVLDVDRMRLYLELDRPLNLSERELCRNLLIQRGSGVPLAQIVGYRDFFRHRFLVTKDTLIPRPDTECLVEAAISHLQSIQSPVVLDIGTGSGCIAISVALAMPSAKVEAWEISQEALAVARSNAELLCVENLELVYCDALRNDSYTAGCFDVIVSNPPYIPPSERSLCSLETLNYEPCGALFTSDEDGLTFYRHFAKYASKIMTSSGRIFLEVGFSQAEKVAQLFETQGWRKIEIAKDFSGHQRVISADRPAV
jgi:release factor glutamine methyltransferase